VPLAALAGWRARLLYLGSAALTLALWVIPIVGELPRMARWITRIATHQGRYGLGEPGMIGPWDYARQLGEAVAGEPLYAALAGVGLLLGGVAVLVRARLDGRRRRLGACLLAVSVAQLALLAVVAKHPAGHYLAAGAGVGGLSL